MSSDELATMAQKAARGGLFLFVGNAISTVILAIGTIIVARLVGPSGYGLYTVALVIPVFLVSLSDGGMNFAVVRLPARLRSEGNYARANMVLRLGLLIKLTSSTVAFLICYAFSTAIAAIMLNRPELAGLLQLASLVILFQAIFDGTNNSFIGKDLMQYSARAQIIMSILKCTLGPALILIGFGIGGAICGYVLALAAAGLTSAITLFGKSAHSSEQTSYSVSKELRGLLAYGLPLYFASISNIFMTQYQGIVLPHFASNIEIGNFNASWNFNALLMILTYPISMAIFPMFSKMDPKNRSGELARAFHLAVKYSSLIMIPASVAVMVFSRELIYLVYGSAYSLAPRYLVWMSAIYLLAAIGYTVLGNFLNGLAETKTVVRMSVLAVALYVPLGPALALLWGPYGLLVADILSTATSVLYGISHISARFDARPDFRVSGRILLAALGAAVPTVGLIQFDGSGIGVFNLVGGGLLYLALYLTFVPILGAVDRQDILNLRSLLAVTPAISALANPLFNYESRILSATKRKAREVKGTSTHGVP